LKTKEIFRLLDPFRRAIALRSVERDIADMSHNLCTERGMATGSLHCLIRHWLSLLRTKCCFCISVS